MNKKGIGLELEAPKNNCNDKHCVYHGKLSVRGRQFLGKVKKLGGTSSATVEWQRIFFVPKYQRYEKRRTKLNVHNPECISAKIGDKVRIMECRKISKTKSFIIIERLEQ